MRKKLNGREFVSKEDNVNNASSLSLDKNSHSDQSKNAHFIEGTDLEGMNEQQFCVNTALCASP
jgi:hypothetical protein